MDAGERVLRRDGGAGFTVQAVALEAGVSIGGIYRRFQTKQDLLRAIKDRFLTVLEQKVAAAMENDFESLGEVIRAFLLSWLPADDRLLAVLIEGGDEVMLQRGVQSTARLRQIFEKALRPFRDRIAHADPDAAISMAFLFATGVIIRQLRVTALGSAAGPSPAWPEVRRELSRALIAYLQTPSG
jgi:AcrR family transcriptional regulator